MDGDTRTLVTTGSNVILAKNRYGLPPELPLSWDAFISAVNAARPAVAPQPAGEAATLLNWI